MKGSARHHEPDPADRPRPLVVHLRADGDASPEHEIAAAEFSEMLDALRTLVESDLVALEEKLEAAEPPGRRAAVSRSGNGRRGIEA